MGAGTGYVSWAKGSTTRARTTPSGIPTTTPMTAMTVACQIAEAVSARQRGLDLATSGDLRVTKVR